jgi:hypothetical protein
VLFLYLSVILALHVKDALIPLFLIYLLFVRNVSLRLHCHYIQEHLGGDYAVRILVSEA